MDLTEDRGVSTVRMDSDEWYPVYSIRDDDRFGLGVEVTSEQVERWARVAAEFEQAQTEMAALYDAAAEVERERKAREKAKQEAREREEQKAARVRLRAEQEARERGWQRLREAGGYAYDADGNVIGRLSPDHNIGAGRVRIEPVSEERP